MKDQSALRHDADARAERLTSDRAQAKQEDNKMTEFEIAKLTLEALHLAAEIIFKLVERRKPRKAKKRK